MDDASDIAAIVKDFLVETSEHLDRLDEDVLALESNATDAERLASVFRSFHTIKGTCAWLGFAQLEALAHSAESMLSALRDGSVKFDSELASMLLAACDAIRRTLPTIEETQSEGQVDFADLRNKLDAHNPDREATPVSIGFATAQDALREVADPTLPASTDRTVRVDVQLLDRLMNYVGELVLARNQIVQGLDQPGSVLAPAATQRLKTITSELQQGVMKARLQPIGTVWNKLPRLVREIARSVAKDVRLTLEGQDTEVDRSLLQAIKDPLTHLVRNAVDHGIETAEARRAAGKTAHGNVRLRAYHEGGQVIVEVSDDGAGLDLPRVKGVAVARQLITSQQAMTMSDRDLTQLVFRPGFSTRQAVTNISGRGVGLDVVKTHVERIGGTIEIDSTRAQGTTLRLKVPLTLAIIQALVVRAGGARYALAQVNVVELVRVGAAHAAKLIDHVYAAPVLRLRGGLVPLVDLSQLLGQSATRMPDLQSDAAVNVVIVEASRQRFGLIVDSIGDNEEIVVKPLSRHLADIPIYAGATVMSDGKVGLILDTQGIAQHAHVLERSAAQPDVHGFVRESGAAIATRRYLLASSRDGGQLAVPLESVDRLEEIKAAQLERLGSRDVIQYRGGILPLVRLGDFLEERRQRPRDAKAAEPRGDDTFPTIVYRDGGTRIGIVVDRIIDVISDSSGAEVGAATRRGSVGTIIVAGKVTELLDLKAVRDVARGRREDRR